jgi:hypothetical protein
MTIIGKIDGWYEGRCKDCGSAAMATGGKVMDYHYSCSNPNCKNSSGCEQYDLDDIPNWIDVMERHCRIKC